MVDRCVRRSSEGDRVAVESLLSALKGRDCARQLGQPACSPCSSKTGTWATSAIVESSAASRAVCASTKAMISAGGMMVGMTTKSKIAVSLPTPLVEAAREAVTAGRASNVSAYVARALEEQVKLDDLDSLLDELLATSGGALTDEERQAIDREVGWQ